MREPHKDRIRLEHISTSADNIARYIKGNWDEWGKNEVVIKETATHKSLVQTAVRMKKDGLPTKQISRYTGLKEEEIINL